MVTGGGELGVPRLVGIEERVASEVLEEERTGDEREQHAAPERAPERRRGHPLWTRRGRR